MTIARAKGWSYRYPPNIQFELNQESSLSQDLVSWWPLGIDQFGSNRIIERQMRRIGSLTGVDAKYSIVGEMPAFHADNTGAALTAWIDWDNDVDLLGSGSTPWSVSIWVYSTGIAGASDIDTVLNLVTGGTNGSLFVISNLDGFDPWTFGCNGADPFQRLRAQPSGDYQYVNQWALLTATYNGQGAGTIGNYALYENGQSVSVVLSAAGFPGGIQTNAFARYGTNTNQPFHGYIGPTTIHQRNLTPSEVLSQYAPDTRWELYKPVISRFWPIPAAPAADEKVIYSNLIRSNQIPIHQLQL